MAKATLTKRVEFSASHRYHNPSWNEEKNLSTFGLCYHEHGHNYILEVALHGEVDPMTGMIINLYDLKQFLTEVLEEFDHKHLNLDTPYFQDKIPSTENLALLLWEKISLRLEGGELDTLRLIEGHDLWAELLKESPDVHSVNTNGQQGTLAVQITRQYSLPILYSFSPSPPRGKPYILQITIRGPLDSITGRVTDLFALDTLVQEKVIKAFSDRNLQEDFQQAHQFKGSEQLTKNIWKILFPHIPGGRLEKVALLDTQDYSVEYTG